MDVWESWYRCSMGVGRCRGIISTCRKVQEHVRMCGVSVGLCKELCESDLEWRIVGS